MALFCEDVSAIVRCACAAMPWVSSGPCDCATTTDKPAEERASGAARMPATRIGNAARLCMHDSPIGIEPLPANARRRLLVHTLKANVRAQPCGGVWIAPFVCRADMPPEIRPRLQNETLAADLRLLRCRRIAESRMSPINSGFLSTKPTPEGSGIMYYSTLYRGRWIATGRPRE